MSKRKFIDLTTSDKRPTKKVKLSPANQLAVTMEVKRQLARKDDYKQWSGRDIAATGIINTGYVVDMSLALARGDLAKNEFEGEKIFPKNLKVRVQWEATDANNLLRFIIVQWFGPGVPATTDILDTSAVAATQQALCFRQWSRRHQYKILYDKLFQLQNTGGLVVGLGPVHAEEIYIPGYKLRPVEFSATTTNLQKGGLFLMTWSDSLAVAHPTQNLVWEIVFTD